VVLMRPIAQLRDARANQHLLEQRPHAGPDDRRVKRVDAVAQQDEARRANGGRRDVYMVF
jgi:hypothetical protein